jgi:hypothetical protein
LIVNVYQQVEYARRVFGQIEAIAAEPQPTPHPKLRIVADMAAEAAAQLMLPPTPYSPPPGEKPPPETSERCAPTEERKEPVG